MRVKMMVTVVMLACALVPGSARLAQAGSGNAIRIATLAPRSSDLVTGLLKIDKGLQKQTGGKWKFKIYAGGIAGDEKDALRKMKVGQMDSAVVTSVGLSLVLKELAILTTPGVIETYEEMEKVQKALNPEWDKKLDAEGYKIMGWGDVGMLRYFTKAKLTSPYDLKKMRPWVWPQSHTMKSTMHAIGATGVPLGVPEVYGGLQTGMIDAVITSALAAVALRWHSKLDHVTKKALGPLIGGMVIARKKWDSLPPDVQSMVGSEITKNYQGANQDTRKQDVKALKKLLKRGYTASAFSAQGEKDYKEIGLKARNQMVGRVYPKALLDRVLKVAGK